MAAKKSLSVLLLSLTLLAACPAKKQEAAPAAPPTAPSAPAATESKPEAKADTNPAINLATPTDAVKGFYDAVVAEKYNVAWASLTKTSQDKFISMVASDEKMDPAKVRELFEQNQPAIRMGFWNSFRTSSKLETVVPSASYKVLNETPTNAEVELTAGEVVLKSKAFKEGGQWKMGYVETFLP